MDMSQYTQEKLHIQQKPILDDYINALKKLAAAVKVSRGEHTKKQPQTATPLSETEGCSVLPSNCWDLF